MSNTPRKRAPAKAAGPQQSQRERLLGRQRPALRYPLLVDPEGAERARAELERVQVETRQVRLREDANSAAHKRADKRLTDAAAAVDACYEQVILRAVPPARLAELEAEHPPTAEQIEQVKQDRTKAKSRGEDPPDWPSYDEATFYPALLAESATEADMTAEDWATFLAEHVSDGERRGLFLAALAVNTQERAADSLVLPKGWSPTTSWR